VCAFGSPGTGLRFDWHEETRDNGNQVVISTNTIFGIKKCTFNGEGLRRDRSRFLRKGPIRGSTARAGQSNGTASALTLVQYAQTIAQTTSNTADRSIGLAVTTAAATNPATARRLDFTLFFRWSRYGA
jgi:hypothetical protein